MVEQHKVKKSPDTATAQKLLNLAALFEYPTAPLSAALDVDFESLQQTYVRLFVNNLGGVQAPPYAGCYLPDRDRLEFMSYFSGACRRSGVALKATQPPDYIPLMMEVLALLLSQGAQGQDVAKMVAPCFDEWPQRFVETLEQHDDIGVYVAAAKEFKALLDAF